MEFSLQTIVLLAVPVVFAITLHEAAHGYAAKTFGDRTAELQGRITLNRMVELLATNPAKLFGLYPRKGTLAVGSDADVVVFDLEKRVTIPASTHHSRSDYNLFEGTEVQGSPDTVLLRGNVLVENDELVAKPGIGQFVKRARFGDELKPSALATA